MEIAHVTPCSVSFTFEKGIIIVLRASFSFADTAQNFRIIEWAELGLSSDGIDVEI